MMKTLDYSSIVDRLSKWRTVAYEWATTKKNTIADGAFAHTPWVDIAVVLTWVLVFIGLPWLLIAALSTVFNFQGIYTLGSWASVWLLIIVVFVIKEAHLTRNL